MIYTPQISRDANSLHNKEVGRFLTSQIFPSHNILNQSDFVTSSLSIPDLQHEINQNKSDIVILKQTIQNMTTNRSISNSQPSLQTITEYQFQKWYTTVFIKAKDFFPEVLDLIDSGQI